MGLIDKWNSFSRKRIYINSHFEIPVGRLVFTLLLTLSQIFSILALTGNIAAIFPSLSNMLLTLREKCEEEECKICGKDLLDSEKEICNKCKKKINDLN